jgi:hypothetical protein
MSPLYWDRRKVEESRDVTVTSKVTPTDKVVMDRATKRMRVSTSDLIRNSVLAYPALKDFANLTIKVIENLEKGLEKAREDGNDAVFDAILEMWKETMGSIMLVVEAHRKNEALADHIKRLEAIMND